ncbi:MAG: preprotein translocase subunit SecG [Verrucomicrobia bacterium]|nr:preprotein translocase subunit SecG [Verrucomicrobiota bacterium]
MITVFIWLLTAVLLIDCLFLVLLVLVQLPKKDAGAGLAFGGAATDALFGAGSGTALTKITKYAATIFFVVTLALAALHSHDKKDVRSAVQELMKQESSAPATQPNALGTPATLPEVIPAAPQGAPAPVPPAANDQN